MASTDDLGNQPFQHAILNARDAFAVAIVDMPKVDVKRKAHPYESEEVKEESEDGSESSSDGDNVWGKPRRYKKKRAKKVSPYQRKRAMMKRRRRRKGGWGMDNEDSDEEMEEMVVKAPVDPEKDKSKSTFGLVLSREQLGLAYLMIDQGVKITSAVTEALRNGKFQLVLTLLSKTKPKDFHEKDEYGRNLFHALAMYECGDEETFFAFQDPWTERIASRLFDEKVSFDDKDNLKCTPFVYAVRNEHVALAEMFLKRGASVDMDDPLSGMFPFHFSAINGDGMMMKLLHAHKLGINEIDNDEKTALHLAVEQSDYKSVHLLLNLGADVNAPFYDGTTPLMQAVKAGNAKMIVLLPWCCVI